MNKQKTDLWSYISMNDVNIIYQYYSGVLITNHHHGIAVVFVCYYSFVRCLFAVEANLCTFFFIVCICIVVEVPVIRVFGLGSINGSNPETEPGCLPPDVVVYLCSVVWGERWFFVLLILLELLTNNIFFHYEKLNYYSAKGK